MTYDFILSLSISNSSLTAMKHLNVLSRLNPKVKYLNVLTLETVAIHETIQMEESDMVDYYGNLIYDDLNSLTTGVSTDLHFKLDDYKTLFFKIANENICSNFF